MFDIIAYTLFGCMATIHAWFLIRCAQANHLQLVPLRVLFPAYIIGVAMNLAIFGLWLEWSGLFMFSGVILIPLSIFNFRQLWHAEGLARVAAMHAEDEAFRAAKAAQPAEPPRAFRQWVPNTPAVAPRKRYDPFAS